MSKPTKRQQQAQFIRSVRKIHRYTGLALFALFMVIAITGLLLGWKKNSNGYLLPKSKRGTSIVSTEWLSIDALQDRAQFVLDSLTPTLDPTIDRIDIRPDKGMVKFTFKQHYQEVQLDCANGAILSFSKRRSDFIEQLHDGSIVDRQTGGSFVKLLYTTIMGLALLIFTLTGFWLWYGPKRMRKS